MTPFRKRRIPFLTENPPNLFYKARLFPHSSLSLPFSDPTSSSERPNPFLRESLSMLFGYFVCSKISFKRFAKERSRNSLPLSMIFPSGPNKKRVGKLFILYNF